jgi:prevent-host-death family protein
MKSASAADVKAHFSTYLKASAEGPIVVTRKGKPVAILSAVTDEEELERLLMAHSPQLQAILEAARQRLQTGVGIANEDFWEEVERDKETKKRGSKRRKPA